MGYNATLTAIFGAQDKLSNTLAGVDKHGNRVTDTFKKMATAAAAAFSVGKATQFANETAKLARNFESRMSEVYTLLPDISATAMDKMERDVRNFAKSTGTLTSEVTPALYQAISAGVPQDNVFEFLKTANAAAIGGVSSLETAVDGLSSVTNAYGTDVLSVQTASDQMFTAVKLGKTTFDEMASYLFQVVPTASAVGLEFGNVTAALAVMTAQGVPTSVATTQLRQALVELSDGGTEVAKTFKELTKQNFKEFIAEGGNLQGALQVLEAHATKTNVGLNELFGSVEAGNAVLSLTGSSTQKFADALDAMESSVGATETAYETMESTAERKLAKLTAAWDVAKTEIGTKVMEMAAPIIDWVSKNMDGITGTIQSVAETGINFAGSLWSYLKPALEWIKQNSEPIGAVVKEVVSTVKSVATVAISAIKDAWQFIQPVVNWVKSNPTLIATAIKGIGGAIITSKIVGGLGNIASGIKNILPLAKNLLSVIGGSGPIGIIAGVATAIGGIGIAIHELHQAQIEANLAENFGNITLSASEMHDVAQRILLNDDFGKLELAMSHFDTVADLSGNIKKTVDELERLEWKVGIGLELTEGEQEDYKRGIESFLDDTQKLIEEQHYGVTLAFEYFLGSSDMGSKITNDINGFYDGIYRDFEQIGIRLRNTVNDAFADGILDLDEIVDIGKLRQQAIELQNKITMGEMSGNLDRISREMSGADLDSDTYKALRTEMLSVLSNAGKTIEDNFKQATASLPLLYEMGSQEYEDAYAALVQGRDDAYAEIQRQYAEFANTTQARTYGDNMGNLPDEMADFISGQKFEGNVYDYNANYQNGAKALIDANMSQADNAAMKTAFGNDLEKTMERMGDAVDGIDTTLEKLPNDLAVALADTAFAATMFENETGDWGRDFFKGAMMSNEEFARYEAEMKAQYAEVPEWIVRGFESRESLIYTWGENFIYTLAARFRQGAQNSTQGIIDEMSPTYSAAIKALRGESNLISDNGSQSLYHYAGGTDYAARGLALVGENGPELMYMHGGETVIPANETAQMLGYTSSVPQPSSVRGYGGDTAVARERVIIVRLEGVGELRIDPNMTREQIEAILGELVRPAMVSAIMQEVETEGDRSYVY